MKAKVTDDCIGCGLCATLCPEVFQMDDSEERSHVICDDEAYLDQAREAAASCPVNAIEVE